MTILRAWRDGLGRVLSAPAIWLGMLVVTLVVAAPLGLAVRSSIGSHLGDSIAADTAASGVNYDWWQEFTSQASGAGVTFTPTIIGFAAVLDNLSAMADNTPRARIIVGAATAYLAAWTFLIGGILDRYARNRRTRALGFFSASGVFFFRFLRLALLMWIVYYALFDRLHPWLFETYYVSITRDLTVERTAFIYRAVLYVLFFAVVAACTLLFDYAKIRAVVEDRRSMLGALIAAGRFIVRHPLQTAGLYLVNVASFVAVIAVYALVAPGAGSSGASVWVGFLIAQAYLAMRMLVKLTFYASQLALFQQALAHAPYAAAPLPVWPDSPSAEALANAAK